MPVSGRERDKRSKDIISRSILLLHCFPYCTTLVFLIEIRALLFDASQHGKEMLKFSRDKKCKARTVVVGSGKKSTCHVTPDLSYHQDVEGKEGRR